ncbi:hypothetical protein P171DRAFT_426729 [Karstenula rhodostoma CBS 690.94]|uniref:Uncharacterized protein n=1 Tax=Karstenula rhodostoma CBS 690.94 TaxID=1392251 RepID=A0A9P4PU50_9PLEO|nr:hypothetical protein P171DRAFT_426729 [Karstenula rhodostoma CBS 690.94]
MYLSMQAHTPRTTSPTHQTAQSPHTPPSRILPTYCTPLRPTHHPHLIPPSHAPSQPL